MHAFHVSIAGFYFKIVFKRITTDKSPLEFARQRLMSEVLYYLSAFTSPFVPKKTDVLIHFEDDLNLERVRRKTDNSNFILHYKRHGNTFTTNYHTSISQFSFLLEDILYELLEKNNGFGLHASANVINKKTFLFLGKSGAGKSTISTILGERFRVLADDNVILRRIHGKYCVFQTPFHEKSIEIWKSPFAFPLEKIFFLHKGSSTNANPVNSIAVLKQLIQKQILGFENTEAVSDFIKVNQKNGNRFYNLQFTKKSSDLFDFLEKIKA